MSKNLTVAFGVVTLLLFFSNVGFTQELEKTIGIGARISYLDAKDTQIGDENYDPDATSLFEANCTWFIHKMFSLELLAGYAKTDIEYFEPDVTSTPVEFGELKQIPILLTGRLHYWFANPNLTLYGGGGVGYYINDFSVSSLILSFEPGLTVDADDSFGFHLAAGLEWFFSANWALNLDLKYIWNEADFVSTEPGESPETDKIDLDSFVVGVGIKYYW